jgi:hypothetical protein
MPTGPLSISRRLATLADVDVERWAISESARRERCGDGAERARESSSSGDRPPLVAQPLCSDRHGGIAGVCGKPGKGVRKVGGSDLPRGRIIGGEFDK